MEGIIRAGYILFPHYTYSLSTAQLLGRDSLSTTWLCKKTLILKLFYIIRILQHRFNGLRRVCALILLILPGNILLLLCTNAWTSIVVFNSYEFLFLFVGWCDEFIIRGAVMIFNVDFRPPLDKSNFSLRGKEFPVWVTFSTLSAKLLQTDRKICRHDDVSVKF